MSTSTIVRVQNNGPAPLKLGWDGTTWVVKPAQSTFVPLEAAVLAFGDPYLRDEASNPSRSEEYRRIRIRYGVYSDLHKIDDYVDEKGKSVAGHFPKVQVFTAEGEELPMLIHDPEGENLTPAGETGLDASQDLIMSRLDAIERENTALRDELAKRSFERASAAVSIGDDGGPQLPAAVTVDGAADVDGAELSDADLAALTAELAARGSGSDVAVSDNTDDDGLRVDGPPDQSASPGRGRPLKSASASK